MKEHNQQILDYINLIIEDDEIKKYMIKYEWDEKAQIVIQPVIIWKTFVEIHWRNCKKKKTREIIDRIIKDSQGLFVDSLYLDTDSSYPCSICFYYDSEIK